MSRKAFIPIVMILILGGLLIAGAGIWYYTSHHHASAPTTSSATGSSIIASGQCVAIPYPETIPLGALPYYAPGEIDVRGGMNCTISVNAKLPLFYLHFVGQPDDTFNKINITEGSSTNILQTIALTDKQSGIDPLEMSPAAPDGIVSNDDVNFDGYNDLAISVNVGASGNQTENIYEYDISTNQFVYNTFLSGLGTPSFNSSTQQVVTSWNSSAADYESDVYQFHDATYTLIEKDISSSHEENDKVPVGEVLMQIFKRVNGTMKLVSSSLESELGN